MGSVSQDGLSTVPDSCPVGSDSELDAGTSGEAVVPGAAQGANEASAALIGRCSSGGWSGELVGRQFGDPASVEFDWAWVLAREEEDGDVIGFYHTHPAGSAGPSQRDVRTMRAWVSCFGKPLLCLIEGGTELAAYLFETDEDDGQPVPWVQRSGDEIAVTRPHTAHSADSRQVDCR